MANCVSMASNLPAPLSSIIHLGVTCYNGCHHSVDCTAPSPGGSYGKSCSGASYALWSSEGPVYMKVCTASTAISHLPERQETKIKKRESSTRVPQNIGTRR